MRPSSLTRAAGLALAACVAPAASDALAADRPDGTQHAYAYVYDLESDQYLYTEVHDFVRAGGTIVSANVRYVLPDGSELGHKTIDYGGDPLVPKYRLELTKEGYVEGITANGDTVTMMKQPAGGAAQTATIAKDGLCAADAGLMRLLQSKLDALLRGETVSFRVIAPSRLSSYKFRAKRVEDATFEGRAMTRIQVDMDSMLKLFAGPLFFTFDADRHLAEFRGPTNVRNPATGKDYVVRLAFYSTPPRDAPPLPGR